MTQTAPSHAALAARRDWRGWHLIGLTALSAYSTGVAYQAQQVSYPLYRAVGAEDFATYHLAYNAAIPWVVIVPGFVTFLASAAFPWTRPHEVSRTAAAVVSVAGVVSLLSTVLWAIPMHDRLDAIGPSPATIESLLQANLLRSVALTVGTLALAWSVARLVKACQQERPVPGS
jgi:hypothetical protein